MCYKDEKQKEYEHMLNKSLNKYNTPRFIQRYFIGIESKVGAINYWSGLKKLFTWLLKKGVIQKESIADLTPDDFLKVESEDIVEFLKEEESGGIAPTTIEVRKQQLRSFWNYLVRIHDCPVTINIIEHVRYKGLPYDNTVAKYATDQQLHSMEENVGKKKDDFLRIRNLAVLRIIKGTGIRESELCGLDLEDIFLHGDPENKEMDPFIVVLSKGKYRKDSESRHVYLTKDSINAIIEYIDVRNKKDNIIDKHAFFINNRGKRLKEKSVRDIFRQYGKDFSPHMVRHWYATTMEKYNGGLSFASKQLGHKNLRTTTNHYVNSIENMRDILAQM